MTGQHVFAVSALICSAIFGWLSLNGYRHGKVYVVDALDGSRVRKSDSPLLFRILVVGYLLISIALLAFGVVAFSHKPRSIACGEKCPATPADRVNAK